jgi:hypothetical protein
MTAHAELDGTKTTPYKALSPSRIQEPADESDVMHEQLGYLIEHAAERGICGCSECQRYYRVRSLLLEIFSEPEPQPAQQLTALPMAA